MADRGMGSEGFAVARPGGRLARPLEVARALNHAVVATEWVARLILLLAGMLVMYYAADRTPPFGVVSSTVPEAQAGEYVTIKAKVRRDVSRGCNSETSRFVFDSAGVRYDLGHASFSAETIARMERQTPGELVVGFRIPPNVAPGPATLTTVVIHRCNRVHAWLPIESTVDMPFVVLP